MSDTKFTEGPWSVQNNGDFQQSIIVDGPHRWDTIAEVRWLCTDGGNDESEAIGNARLIAAAPELYDALVGVLKVIADENYSDESYAAFQNAQVTLAKARGEVTA